jgi:hypothetical protein
VVRVLRLPGRRTDRRPGADACPDPGSAEVPDPGTAPGPAAAGAGARTGGGASTSFGELVAKVATTPAESTEADRRGRLRALARAVGAAARGAGAGFRGLGQLLADTLADAAPRIPVRDAAVNRRATRALGDRLTAELRGRHPIVLRG